MVVTAKQGRDKTINGSIVYREGQYEIASFKNCKAILMDSDCMVPVAYKGQKVIFSETEPVQNGDLVLIKLKTGEYYFKRIYKNKCRVTLTSVNPVEFHNPMVISMDDIEFYYRIVGVIF